ncbi:MAG: hypothetical protein E7406_02085 [Ruminococcaceae bacterium]|nr:hypothetical protein [Oscillospiraceae bacterium]
MKRIFHLFVAMIMCFSLVAYGGNTDSKGDTSTESNQTQQGSETGNTAEITIDEVAEKLGFTGGTETFYSMIGAIDGKEYNNGTVELYQFEKGSEAYKDIINGTGYLKAATHKEGIVLIFPLGEPENAEIIDAFNALEF